MQAHTNAHAPEYERTHTLTRTQIRTDIYAFEDYTSFLVNDFDMCFSSRPLCARSRSVLASFSAS